MGQNSQILSPAGNRVTHGTAGFYPTDRLSGRQKAAVIVRLLLAEGAELPLLGLPEHLQAAITEQIGTMHTIDRDTLKSVVEEFCTILEQVGLSFPGGIDKALALLDGHISPAAATRLRQMAGSASLHDPWEKIRTFEVERLLQPLTEESIEVSAVILSKIAVPRAADLLGRLPGARARAIAYSMSQTANIAPEMVRQIGLALVAQIEVKTVSAFDGDPVHRVGAILNVTTAATRDEVMKGLEETDIGLAEQVRKTIFTFAHIPTRLLARDVPKILRGVDQAVLVTALGGAKGPGVEAAEFILANMSQRMAATLREEIAGMGRVRDKDVEAAQTALIIAIRDLVDQGELLLIVDEDDADESTP